MKNCEALMQKKEITTDKHGSIQMKKLPDGWVVKKLGEVCDIVNGGTPKTNIQDFWNGNHLWITPAEMGKRISPIVNDTARKLTDSGLRNSSAQLLPEYSIILSSRAPIGHLVINEMPMAFNQGCKGLIPKDRLYYYFLYHFLVYNVDYLNSLGTGATFKELSAIKLKEVEIPLPPLSEQKRIVAILDEAFAAIDKAKANAEKNLANAKELFESYLNGIFSNPGEDWEEKKLGEIVENIITGPFGSMLHKSDYTKEGIPVINPQNIVDGQIIPLQNTMINEVTFNRLKKYALKLGDIIIARRGEMGRCAITKTENVGWLCGTGSFVIRVNQNKAVSDFLSIFLGSESSRKELEKSSIGATMSNLNQSILSDLRLNIPPIQEQKVIVHLLNSFRLETQKLEIIYQQKITELDELKKSILKKAFAGEL